MNNAKWALLALATVIYGCGDRSTPNAGEQNSGSVVPKQSAKKDSLDSSAINGIWKGELGGDGEMIVENTPKGISVGLKVNSGPCSGEVNGIATGNGNTLALKTNQDGQECVLNIEFKENSAEIDEVSCSAFHGQSCGFTGELKRVSGIQTNKQLVSGAAPMQMATPAPQQQKLTLPAIVGCYKPGEAGRGSSWLFFPDGTYYFDASWANPGDEPKVWMKRAGQYRQDGEHITVRIYGQVVAPPFNPTWELNSKTVVSTMRVQNLDGLTNPTTGTKIQAFKIQEIGRTVNGAPVADIGPPSDELCTVIDDQRALAAAQQVKAEIGRRYFGL